MHMRAGETLTVYYERKISDGNYGSEGLSLGITMSLVDDEPVEEALNDGVTIRALAQKVRHAVLLELAHSEASRVAAVAAAELNGKLPSPGSDEDDVEVDLERLPF